MKQTKTTRPKSPPTLPTLPTPLTAPPKPTKHLTIFTGTIFHTHEAIELPSIHIFPKLTTPLTAPLTAPPKPTKHLTIFTGTLFRTHEAIELLSITIFPKLTTLPKLLTLPPNIRAGSNFATHEAPANAPNTHKSHKAHTASPKPAKHLIIFTGTLFRTREAIEREFKEGIHKLNKLNKLPIFPSLIHKKSSFVKGGFGRNVGFIGGRAASLRPGI